MTDAFDVTLDSAHRILRGQPDDGLLQSAPSAFSIEGGRVFAPIYELLD